MKGKLVFSTLLLFSLVLSSCLPIASPASVPTADTTTIAQLVSQALATQFAQQTANAPTATPTLTPTPTPTSVPANTPAPGVAPVVSATLCDSAAFIEDITIPDGTQISPGDSFTKTWRIQNTGSCTWTPAFKVVFESGNLLGAPSASSLDVYVNPGQAVDISVDMQAPDVEGVYEGFWKIEDPNGTIFGVGANAASAFDVQIVVGSSVAAFEVRHVDMSVNTSSVTTSCPPGNTFTISATIRTNGSGDVDYFWEFSNGDTSDEHTLNFGSSRSKTVSTTFTADATGTYWARIHTDSPDSETFDKVFFSLTCQAPQTPTPTTVPATPGVTPMPTATATLPVPTATSKPMVPPTLPAPTATPTVKPTLPAPTATK